MRDVKRRSMWMGGVVLAAMSFCAAGASAQIVYEPVQSQYFAGGRAYYYGGSDPRVHYSAARESGLSSWGRSNGYAFHSGNIDTHREVSTEPTRIYTDQVPGQNARFFGYTADDAQNQANANSYSYFRKADLLRTAIRQSDGTWVVPAQPSPARGTIQIILARSIVRPMIGDKKAPAPKPVLIIPKRLLDKPLWGSDQQKA